MHLFLDIYTQMRINVAPLVVWRTCARHTDSGLGSDDEDTSLLGDTLLAPKLLAFSESRKILC